ncbi:hypothetical protein Y88_3339 [Novosphingobium nitrogenifigens DSM 19370]|uniref:Uncharacterized protein n=1 Tax=Novosphingobium nitrogenifigens DSM 19370 TaxID=983920 RepID=F1ZBR5_9SPHN|nr:hypothetical protein [Novosphingobium nitrogenifigens]EGD58009.1 hypothetical protein Y88_3339 [Novosphingobium nitrogenifigens DSM 19370]
MSAATDTLALIRQLTNLIGASSSFWPNSKAPQLDDLYEAYLWAETVGIAKTEGWQVDFVNAGSQKNQFTFRKGPGLLTSPVAYTYATLTDGRRSGELHIGIRIRGDSSTLHEFDVVALDAHGVAAARAGAKQPGHSTVRLHVEAKFHKGDLSLGVARGIVGLGADCPSIEPFLVSKALGSPSLRPLIKSHGGHYVDRMFPGDSGIPYFATCVKAALGRWR